MIWTSIFTVISLVLIIAGYYGYTRYIQLRMKSPETYIKNYKNLPKATEQRTVISFTTTPDRFDKIKPFISSILDQTVRVDQILFPCTQKYELPQYLKDIVTVCPAGKDYGDGTKFIPVLLKEKNADTSIIVLKDNVVYGKDYIEYLTTEGGKYPKSVITDQNRYGMLIKPECYDCNLPEKNNGLFDEAWFLQNAKDLKVVVYDENHKY
jgi:hypothetical protein